MMPLLCLSCAHASTTPASWRTGVASCNSPHKTNSQDRVVTNCVKCSHYVDAHTEPLTFSADQITLILKGQKNGTMRRTKHGEIGDIFYVAGIPYRIIDIERTYRSTVSKLHWRREGLSSKDETEHLLNTIYPDLPQEAIVYYHTFAAVLL